ncbi:helix-turn-helix domain-containing protein [Streptomyces sp. NPDC046900]|uniref:TetR/AcrR family transcriptional regulator n=1 Tax=Streptomyces sp. NPDC046900 TaxID=3155473 RepID=UPI0033C02056
MSDPRMPRPVQRLPRAEPREQILEAAAEAFARSGFAATSLDDIAAQAGITRSILYRHFDSETDLYQGRGCWTACATAWTHTSASRSAASATPAPTGR